MIKNKSLNFVYNWIGPNGPLPNHKVPDIYDLIKKAPYSNIEHNSITDEHDSIVFDLSCYINCNCVPCFQLDSDINMHFLFEIVLSPKNHFLQNTLCIGSGFLERASVDEKILELVRHKNGYILLTSKHESFVDDDDFNLIHNYFKYHNLPLEKIIYVTNCFNATQMYEEFCKRTNQAAKIKCEYLNLYLLDQRNLALRRDFIRRGLNVKDKKKLFLNWNRRVKPHRILFLLYAIRNNLFDRSYISFSKLHITLESWICDAYSLSNQFNLKFTVEDLTEIYNQLPLVLDSNNFDRFPVEEDMISTAKWYDQSYISIASETNFENNIIHMTEKTIKPILFKQPFIIIGPQYTLNSLKKLGFKTFDKFWDESYDNIENNKERFLKIMEVCNNIASWDERELFKFVKRSAEITEYNFKVMQSLKPKSILEFLEKYGS